jgi:hypothetical protein
MESIQKNSKEYYCEICDYKCFKKCNINKHFLSGKHLKVSKSSQKHQKGHNYECKICNYTSKKLSNYNKHINTTKHKNKEYILQNNIDILACECGKKYRKINSLNIHKKKCYKQVESISNIKNHQNENTSLVMTNHLFQNNEILNNFDYYLSISDCSNIIIDKPNNMMNIMVEEIKNMMTENKEFKNMLLEQNKIIQELANKPSITNASTINNNQTNNHQFNMNMFLNETCKDAMNMSEFIENLTVTMEDMEMTGTLGFAKGMSRIIMNNLNALEVHKRPIHCSDAKRETLYVKNNGVWEKDTDDKKHTKELIYKVSSLNLKHLLKWRELPRNKGYDNPEHKKNDEFTILVMEINKVKVEEIEKVVTIISKNVTIDKNKVRMSGYLN